MHTLSYSRLKDFARCSRFHLHAWLLRRVPLVRSRALYFGELFGNALEQWELNRDDDPFSCAMNRWRQDIAQHDRVVLTEYDAEVGAVLLRGYHAMRQGDGLETIDTEVEWTLPLINPDSGRSSRTFAVRGYFDALVRDSDGKIWVKERKTSSEDITLGTVWWERLRANAQASMYFDAGEQYCGQRIEGVLFDVVRKPSSKPHLATPEDKRKYTKGRPCKVCLGVGTVAERRCDACDGTSWAQEPKLYGNQRANDETPAEYAERISSDVTANPIKYYVRGNIVRLQAEVEEARRDMWQNAETMRLQINAGAAPRSTHACFAYHRRCEYWDVCFGPALIDDDARFMDKPKRDAKEASKHGTEQKQGNTATAATAGIALNGEIR